DRARELLPLAGFDIQLPASCRGKSIKLRPPIVLGEAVIERDPTAFDQPVQRGVERSLLHLQHVVRGLLDRLRDRVSMRWTKEQGAKNQQIERALEECDAGTVVSSRHPR